MQDLSLHFFKFRNQKVLNPHKPVGIVSTVFFQRANFHIMVYDQMHVKEKMDSRVNASQLIVDSMTRKFVRAFHCYHSFNRYLPLS